jgi:outer membrane protein assembly factor BamB
MNPTSKEVIYRACRATARVSAVFSLVVGATLVFQFIQGRLNDPLKSPQLTALKEKLRAAPKDEQLKQRIRALDLALRRRYFRHLSLSGAGAWLLVGGVALAVLARKQAAKLRLQLPMPPPRTVAAGEEARAANRARWSVAAASGVVALVCLALALLITTRLPRRVDELDKLLGKGPAAAESEVSDLPAPEEFRRNWPRFRGPDGGGVSVFTNLPLAWDVATGAGILWKAPVPAPGFGSPVVWGNRVFLSGGDAAQREVVCFDALTGALVWRQAVQNVPGSPAKVPEVQERTGYAAATVATDGRRVYAFFANGDLAAFTVEGKLAWAKAFGPLANPYGHATSLVVWQGKLLLQLDQGQAEDGRSKLYAFAGASGRLLWERSRPVPASWATPILIEAAGQPQLVTLAQPWVIAYAASDGAEVWRAEVLGADITPSPVFAGGVVFAISPSDRLLAIKPDGQGDVTKTHVLWTAEDNVPDITSPVSNGELVFTLSTPGVLTCYDGKDGKKCWEQAFEMVCNASPSLAGERLYFFSTKGVAVVVAAARQFQELARSNLGEPVFASPAFASERMFIRGTKTLYCLGDNSRQASK